MRNAWRSFCTELTTIVSDLAVMITIVGGSIFYALFYPLPYQAQIASQLPIAVVDHDRSAKSRELIRLVDAAEQVRLLPIRPVCLRRKTLFGSEKLPDLLSSLPTLSVVFIAASRLRLAPTATQPLC